MFLSGAWLNEMVRKGSEASQVMVQFILFMINLMKKTLSNFYQTTNCKGPFGLLKEHTIWLYPPPSPIDPYLLNGWPLNISLYVSVFCLQVLY